MSTWIAKGGGLQVKGSITKSGDGPLWKKIRIEYDEKDTAPARTLMPSFSLPYILIEPHHVDGLIEALQQVKASLDAVTLE